MIAQYHSLYHLFIQSYESFFSLSEQRKFYSLASILFYHSNRNFSWLYKINITSQLPLQFSVASDQVLRNAMYVNYPMTASEIFCNRYPAGTLCTYFFFLCSIFLLEFGLYFGLWKNIVMEPWAEWTCRLPDIFVK